MRILALFIALLCVASSAEYVREYHFDEGSGSQTGEDAMLIGATWIEGFGGHALRFNPAQIGHVKIPGYGDKGQSNDIIRTFAAWVRTRSEASAGLVECKVLDAIGMRLWEGTVTFAYTEWKGGPTAQTEMKINDGKWHYVVGTGDGNDEATIYIDGELAAHISEAGQGNVINAFGPIFVGGMLAGDMDEIYMSPYTMGQGAAKERYENADPAIRDAPALPASTWETTAVLGAPRLAPSHAVAIPSLVNVRMGALVIPLDRSVSGVIYDASGKAVDRIATDKNGVLRWDGVTRNGAAAASGAYMLRLRGNDSYHSVHHLIVTGGR